MFAQQFPSGTLFLPELARVAEHAAAAAALLRERLARIESPYAHSGAIEAYGREGWRVAQELRAAVTGALITPIDREDLTELAERLAAVTSEIGRADRLAEAVGIGSTDDGAARLAETLAEAADALEGAAASATDTARLLRFAGESRRMDEEADHMYAVAMASALQRHADPVDAVRWRELYGVLRESVRACARAAALFERVALKRT